jgi:DNA-directed RNA polymerase specialized sigma subunit
VTEQKRTLDDLYTHWSTTKDPADLHNVVKAVKPIVNYKLGSMGLADNPAMARQADLIAAEAVRSYDPKSGAVLTSWVQTNMQSMNRHARMNRGPVKVPDRIALDAWTIEKAYRELTDELGDEPDVKTLSDRLKMPVARIAKVRRATLATATDDQAFNTPDGAVEDYLPDAVQYVYDDSDRTDKKLLEWTTGYGGSKVLPKNEIAVRLKMSPSMVSRRTERIAGKLLEMERMMEETY